MPFLGASIIAGMIFFVLSFLSALWLDTTQKTVLFALLEALVKTAIFSTLFHYVHNWIARIFGWYRDDDPDANHVFDKTPGPKSGPQDTPK